MVVLIVVRFERLPLRSIGLRRPDWSTLATATLLFLVGFLLMPLVTNPLIERWGQQGADAGIAELARLPAWFRVVIGATGGAVEETLYRGYAIERLSAITGRRWLGATLATLVFALAHIPAWGVGFALTADLPAGIVFTLFYLWRRDVVANALAHSAGLIVALFTIMPPAA
jgi:membrane protease YdiL (CAAX protease family)